MPPRCVIRNRYPFCSETWRRAASRAIRRRDAVLRLPIRLAILALALISSPHLTRAEPPADADPALRPWFESLKRPGSGASCCTIADCRPVSYRLSADGYEALVGSIWISVPKDTVLRNQHNPLGRAVLCRSPVGTIFINVRYGGDDAGKGDQTGP